MSQLPLEVLLRPPVEMYSGVTALMSSFIFVAMPSVFMMTPSVAYVSAVVLLGFGLMRILQALRILRYQRHLRRLPRFVVKSKKIPFYKNYLYMGHGFLWTQKHTQRLKDTMSPIAKQYTQESQITKTVRLIERKLENGPLAFLARITASDSVLNPFRPEMAIGGNSSLHAIEMKEEEVLLPMSERVGHMLVLGTTRVGKTRLAEILIEQDIRRNEGPVIVFDPKSDAGLLTRMFTAAKRQGMEDKFHVFHLGFPSISARYNAIGNFSRITEIAGRISGQLSAEGNSAAFREFAWRFVNIVARSLVSLGQSPDYNNVLRYVTDIEPLFVEYMEWWLPRNAPFGWIEEVNDLTRFKTIQAGKNPRALKHANPRTDALRTYVERSEFSDPIVLGLLSALRYDKTYFDKLVASLLPLLEKLTTGQIGKLLSPEYIQTTDERQVFDWASVIKTKSIVYVGLDALTDTEVSSAVGNSMFSDLVSTAGSIYKHGYQYGDVDGGEKSMPKIFFHADEFNELMGDEFLPMVNKGGGAGIQIVAYTQSRGDIEAKLGNTAKARQVEGNFNNLIMLRVKEKQTAELFTDQIPDVDVYQKMTVTGTNDSSDIDNSIDFTSSTQDRITTQTVPMLDPSNMTSLPKGQAFALLDGGRIWKLRIPLPAEEKEDMPDTLKYLTEQMRRNYHTSETWWDMNA